MVKEKRDNQAEKAILEAARKVFTQKGFAAARMDEIAREAKINKALLHYYFRSKEKLFDLVFQQRLGEFFSVLATILSKPMPLMEKIAAIIEHDIDMLRSQPDLPIFVMQELAHNPDRMVDAARNVKMGPFTLMKSFKEQVAEAVAKKQIRPIDGGQLLINVMSMAIYPFIAKPIIKAVQGMDDNQFDKMLVQRKKEVARFVMDAIKP